MADDLTRRSILTSTMAVAVSAMVVGCNGRPASPKFAFDTYPFQLGVASGDPLANGFVIWTRLIFDDPFTTVFSPKEYVEVGWEVATDSKFRSIAKKGRRFAAPELGHAIHVEVEGLEPDKDYFYRFFTGDAVSPIGRARTFPAIGATYEQLSFALCCCQSYSHGFYGAFRDLAAHAPELVLHVGDYIYESPWTMPVRRLPAPEARTLEEYRAYHAITKLDKDLQAAHAAAPWLIIWDDHEVVNDYRGLNAPGAKSTSAFSARRSAAYQAYFEHMPVRLRVRPNAGGVNLYQRSIFGDLVQIDLLDTRQFRSDHPCLEENGAAPSWVNCDASSPERTMLGRAQETWLRRGFGVGQTKWNFVVQTTQMSTYERTFGTEKKYSSDRWDAYPAARERLVDLVASQEAGHTILLGGDIHAFFAREYVDRRRDESIATELICGAISSGGGGDDRYSEENSYYGAENLPFYFENRKNGYLLCRVNDTHLNAEVRAVKTPYLPNTEIETIAEISVSRGDFTVAIS